ncbi:MAG: hypothetical protein WCV69_03580 [Patescibacteria group bacterium]|jgi:hypothetical protein
MKPPKFFIIIIIFLVAAFLLAGLMWLRGDEDTWLCTKGQWVKHGNPSASQPTTPCNNK